MKKRKAPGRFYRIGISLMQFAQIFPNEETVEEWFEDVLWPTGRVCGHCGGIDTYRTKNCKPLPYRCRDCKRYFTIKTGTVLAQSPLPLLKWAWAIYLDVTNIKGVSSMKLHRDIGVCQKTAWYMQHRIRETFRVKGRKMLGPVEIDEAHFGGKGNKNTLAVAIKDRSSGRVVAQTITDKTKATLQGVIKENVDSGATHYTDGHASYKGLPNHEAVTHSIGEYVRKMAHVNGVESFWNLLKRAHMGTFHKMSPKHFNRYVSEFAGRHNIRSLDTIDQMEWVLINMVGKRIKYKDLTA